MYLNHLSLTNFRLFRRLEIDLPESVSLLVGDNAQGKTSFLEAVHFFSTLTSIQSGKDRELINFHALEDDLPVSRLVMDFTRNHENHQMEVRLILGNGKNGNGRMRKEVLLDGVKRPLQQALGNFNSVIFLPQMTSIVESGPDVRRRYMDMTIAQVYPGYARELSGYNQAISQRNALLKALAERGGDESQLDYWDNNIAEKGSFLIHTRLNMLREWNNLVSGVHVDLSGGASPLLINYIPGFEFHSSFNGQSQLLPEKTIIESKVEYSAADIREAYLNALKERHSQDIARGVTTIGPHRDELRFFAHDIDMGVYGSRGQIRTVMMALKIGEMLWLNEKTGEWPVLLLDETMAELDLNHRDALLKALQDCEQIFLTATDQSMFDLNLLNEYQIWQVSSGNLSRSDL